MRTGLFYFSRMGGWIKLHDKIIQSAWFDKAEYVQLWIYLMVKANHQPTKTVYKNHTLIIGRGQFLTSRSDLSKATKISEGNVRNILSYFEAEGQIAKENMYTRTCITIVNYELYQTSEDEDYGQRNGQQITGNENSKTVENGRQSTGKVPARIDENGQQIASEKVIASGSLSVVNEGLDKSVNVENGQQSTGNENSKTVENGQQSTGKVPARIDENGQQIAERILDASKNNFFLTRKPVFVDKPPLEFLKERCAIDLDAMGKNSGLTPEEFELSMTAWNDLAVKNGWDYPEQNLRANQDRLMAGLRGHIGRASKKKESDMQKAMMESAKGKLMLLSDFADIGYKFEELTEPVRVALDKFLRYKFERKESILQGQVIESILIKLWGASKKDEDVIWMINNTMANTAKNIIADLRDKNKDNWNGKKKEGTSSLFVNNPKESDYDEDRREAAEKKRLREEKIANQKKQTDGKTIN